MISVLFWAVFWAALCTAMTNEKKIKKLGSISFLELVPKIRASLCKILTSAFYQFVMYIPLFALLKLLYQYWKVQPPYTVQGASF